MERPAIPKRFAQKIRGAQLEVVCARQSIVDDERRIAQDSARIAEYESDPNAFARKYYGIKTADSYPVQTNISRCREDLARRQNRQQERLAVVDSALRSLELVGEEVLYELNRMRPNTPGRVPWPDELLSIDDLRKMDALMWQRMEEEDERADERRNVEAQRIFEAEEIEDKRIQREEEAIADREWQEELSKMSPRERRSAKKDIKAILDGLRSGSITPKGIIGQLMSSKSRK